MTKDAAAHAHQWENAFPAAVLARDGPVQALGAEHVAEDFPPAREVTEAGVFCPRHKLVPRLCSTVERHHLEWERQCGHAVRSLRTTRSRRSARVSRIGTNRNSLSRRSSRG